MDLATVTQFIASCIEVATDGAPQEVFDDLGAEVSGTTHTSDRITVSLTDGRIVTLDVRVEG
jgi:hypothetical protein